MNPVAVPSRGLSEMRLLPLMGPVRERTGA